MKKITNDAHNIISILLMRGEYKELISKNIDILLPAIQEMKKAKINKSAILSHFSEAVKIASPRIGRADYTNNRVRLNHIAYTVADSLHQTTLDVIDSRKPAKIVSGIVAKHKKGTVYTKSNSTELITKRAVLSSLPETKYILDVEPTQAKVTTAIKPAADTSVKEVRTLLSGKKVIMPNQPVEATVPAPTTKVVTSTRFDRDLSVVNTVKKLANGYCELTGERTFMDANGEYFLEVHHVIPLSKGGYDTIDNCVAITPTMHRALHYADSATIDFLVSELYLKVPRLKK